VKKFNFISLVLPILFVLFYSNAIAETKIAIVEIDYLIKNSIAGKSFIKELDKLNKNNIKFFEESNKKLNLEKEKIAKQKNILSNEEYNKKVKSLNNEFKKYKNDSDIKIQSLQKKRDKGMNKILRELKIVLSEYSDQNKLTFIIDQKNIIIGRSDLNVTQEVLKMLNNKIKKITLN
tara:strand:+ start:250 stop:780 length:531 start_codon:yes stop_codon:yes gene_type:complete